jgi:hypothetical protein
MAKVEQVCGHPEQLRFRRPLDQAGMADWYELREIIDNTRLVDGHDRVVWALDSSGSFTVSSMYAKLAQGATLEHFKDIWAARVPLKTRIFSWQLILDRLPSGANVAARVAVRFVVQLRMPSICCSNALRRSLCGAPPSANCWDAAGARPTFRSSSLYLVEFCWQIP